ncbi:MAG: hypothetical protein Unbinned3987contig1001_47 [Prokaryotic dsDNA virus sp.]|jgi:hypothetical protein|nr:MAG: hypothetical protein Unbinned3987contig1001_47 [Prokaryotic dsDNA virus sp.]|tara:strand:- start:600 stop:2306 length:1707 start_codon:yes stop_codon:yes gene_type:complete
MEQVDFRMNLDTGDANKKLDDIKDGIDEIKESSKKTEQATGGLAKGFKGVGLAMKAAGFAIIVQIVGKLTDALMKNQAVADAVETVFNSIGVVFKMVSDTLVSVYNKVSENSANFDALGRILKNIMTVALTPMELAFHGLKLGIQKLALAWHKSPLGSGDLTKINELQQGVDDSKAKIKELTDELVTAGQGIVDDFSEAVGEIKNISTIVADEFKNTFEGVTVNSIIEQGKAITETKKNYGLLALAQQRLVEQYDREAESQRQIRDDVRLTIDERIAANDKLNEILEKQAQAEKDAINAQISAVRQLNALEGETPERLEELYALKTELIGIDAKITGMQSEQKTNEAALQDERIANMQELTAMGQSELDKQYSAIEVDAERKRELARRTISDKQQLEDMLLKIDQDAANQRRKIDQATMDAKLGIASQMFGALSSLAKKDSKAAKKLAVAQALINTYQGITKALASGPPPWNFIQAAAVGLSGMASVRDIMSTNEEGEETADDPAPTGGSGPPGIGPSNQPSMTPNLIGEASTNQQDWEPEPVQAYVVTNDISESQALQNEVNEQTTM